MPFDMLSTQSKHAFLQEHKKCFRPHIEQHRAMFDFSNPRDYIDAFLVEMDSPPNGSKSSFFFGIGVWL